MTEQIGRFYYEDSALDLESLDDKRMRHTFKNGDLVRCLKQSWDNGGGEYGGLVTIIDGYTYGLMDDEVVPLTPLEQLALEAEDT